MADKSTALLERMAMIEGGPAFPLEMSDRETGAFLNCSGMSLRDYFAGQVAMAMINNFGGDVPADDAHVAKRCYAIADAMLEARK